MKTLIGLLGGMILVGGAALAHASVDPACILQARADAKECRTGCGDQLRIDKDACRNVDHACGEACRAGRARCVEPFEEILQTCIDQCQSDLAAAKALCPPEGDPARDACVDAAQVIAFQCRDTCRENQTVRDSIKNCLAAFRACMRACPPAN